jgi:hypothetical protein
LLSYESYVVNSNKGWILGDKIARLFDVFDWVHQNKEHISSTTSQILNFFSWVIPSGNNNCPSFPQSIVFLFLCYFGRLSDSEAGKSGAEPVQSQSSNQNLATPAGNAPPYKTAVHGLFTTLNMGAGVMMAAAGALGVGQANNVNDTGIVFIGLYMLIFAAILFCYEAIQIRPCGPLDLFYKRNFGFLYGPNGKGCYLILWVSFFVLMLSFVVPHVYFNYSIGIMAFGLKSPRPLAVATGVVVSALGFVVIAVNAKVIYFSSIWPSLLISS